MTQAGVSERRLGSVGELTPDRLRELRRIAEAATPGPWTSPWEQKDGLDPEEYGFYGASGDKIVGLFWYDGWHLECSEENARHIATFDPTTVLALLDEIERLRRVMEKLQHIWGWFCPTRRTNEPDEAYQRRYDKFHELGEALDAALSSTSNPYAAVVEAAIAARDAFRLYDNPEKWHKAIAKLARVVEDLDPKLVVALDREEGRE